MKQKADVMWLPSTSSSTLSDAVPPMLLAVQLYSPSSSTLTFFKYKLPSPTSMTLPLEATASPWRVQLIRGAGLPASRTHVSRTSRPTVDSTFRLPNASWGSTVKQQRCAAREVEDRYSCPQICSLSHCKCPPPNNAPMCAILQCVIRSRSRQAS